MKTSPGSVRSVWDEGYGALSNDAGGWARRICRRENSRAGVPVADGCRNGMGVRILYCPKSVVFLRRGGLRRQIPVSRTMRLRVRPGTDRDKREAVLHRWYRQQMLQVDFDAHERPVATRLSCNVIIMIVRQDQARCLGIFSELRISRERGHRQLDGAFSIGHIGGPDKNWQIFLTSPVLGSGELRSCNCLLICDSVQSRVPCRDNWCRDTRKQGFLGFRRVFMNCKKRVKPGEY